MENQQLDQNTSKPEIKLNLNAIQQLKGAGRWSMFLAILGFFGLAIMFLFALFFGFSGAMIPMDNEMPFPMYLISIIYLLMIAVYFVPIYYLYQFSKKTSNIFSRPEENIVEDAFRYLRRHYQYLGILTIIIISIYIISAIIAVIGSFALFS